VRSSWRAITRCASLPTTTPSIRRRSATGRVEMAADPEHVTVICAGQVVPSTSAAGTCLHRSRARRGRCGAALGPAERGHRAARPRGRTALAQCRVSQVSTRIGLPSRKAPMSSTASRKNVA
jgi:hypothetical protein